MSPETSESREVTGDNGVCAICGDELLAEEIAEERTTHCYCALARLPFDRVRDAILDVHENPPPNDFKPTGVWLR